MKIEIDVQCYPPEQRVARLRKPIHDAALAMMVHGKVKPYQIAQALDSVGQFWERYASGDADLEDFENDFDGSRRRQRKKEEAWLAHAISILEPEDECPVCKCGTVELNESYELVCRGECGNVLRPAPEAVCENCGEECAYHPEVCLCEKCEAETQGGQDAEAEGSTDDDHRSSREEADQGDR